MQHFKTISIFAFSLFITACSGENDSVQSEAQTSVSAPMATIAMEAMAEGDIEGVVTSTSGPEAGVWVIAETDDLETRFARIVVTDDQGRYVLPDLP